MTNTWTPPPGSPYLAPGSSGPGMPPRQSGPGKRGLVIAGALLGLAAVVATTAGITYGLTRQASPANRQEQSTTDPGASNTDKNRLCQIFDAGTKGQTGRGGVRVDGALNIPVVVRMINSASAVQNALTPAVPADVAEAAHAYVDRVFDLTTAATGDASGETLVDLTSAANKAIDSLLDSCGLPR